MWKEKLGNYLIDVSKYFFDRCFCSITCQGFGGYAMAYLCA